jgi:hypothetical protein
MASCSSQPGNPWLAEQRVLDVDTHIVIGDYLNNNFELNQADLNKYTDYNARPSESCINSNSQIDDLFFFIFVQLPICAVVAAIGSSDGPSDQEIIHHPTEKQRQLLSSIKSEFMEQFLSSLGDELDLYFPGKAVAVESSVTLNVIISDLYLRPKTNKHDQFQLVGTFKFCVMDNSESIASYTDSVETTGRFRSNVEWLEIKKNAIDSELKEISRRAAKIIFVSLVTKGLPEVLYGEHMPKKC